MKKISLALMFVMALFCHSMAEAKTDFVVSVIQVIDHPAVEAERKGVLDRLNEKGLEITTKVHVVKDDHADRDRRIAQFIAEQSDLVLALATPGAQIAARNIHDRPVLFTGVSDPISAGLVKDLANTDGSNVTGLSAAVSMDRTVALIREFVPELKTIGVIYYSEDPNSVVQVEKFKEQFIESGLKVEEADIADFKRISLRWERPATELAVSKAARSLAGRCQAIFVPSDYTVVSFLDLVVTVCVQKRLPLFAADVTTVQRGAIAAVVGNYYKLGLQTGDMAYKILAEGVDPGSMPIEFLNDLDLFINKRAAAAMGVTLPEATVKRATKIFE